MLNDTDVGGLDKFLADGGRETLRRVCDGDDAVAIGTTLGNWRIAAFLGRGGSGAVYRVADVRAPQLVENAAALKILRRDDEPSRKRFAAERQLLAENESPYLPRLLDSGEWSGHPYLVTELLEPIDLPARDSAIAEYLLSVCKAVSSLHRIGIVHRDLKPKNIMRRPGGTHSRASVVLIDFGLAKDTFASPLPRTDVSIVSGKAVAVGTPGYAAPEQLTGGEVSPAVDIHALGRIANSAFGGKCPHSWEAIIRRATSSIPEQRYDTVDDFAAAVRSRNRRRNLSRACLAAAAFALLAGVFCGRDVLPLVRDVSAQMRFNAICETVATNVVTRRILWEKLETNSFGRVYLKEQAVRNVTNLIDITLVRLNQSTNAFARPLMLKGDHEYWVVGPGILDASIVSAGTNTIMRLKNCMFFNRSAVPLRESGVRYVFQGGACLNFPNMDRPEDFTLRQFEGFDGAFDEVRFK